MDNLPSEVKKVGVVGLCNGAANGISVPKPFEHDVFLFDSYVAGVQYADKDGDFCDKLKAGEELHFLREPQNKFDKRAIVVKYGDVKIGYIPRSDNAVFARLMDAGKHLFGKISAVEKRGAVLKIKIKIYLRD